MHTDIVALRNFYSTPLGHLAERSIAMALMSVWGQPSNERLLGIGYPSPWLDRFRADTERTFAFMPAAQGAASWPHGEPSTTALVFDEELPLPDASIDRVLMVHALEQAENPRETMMEIWRVLAPNGRVLVVAPNRRGLWARFETTPFGTGRPWSRGQLATLMREANFTPGATAEALLFPPTTRRFWLPLSMRMDAIGRRLWPLFAGAIVMEGQKRLYQGLPVAVRQSRRVFVPALAPQAATRSGTLATAAQAFVPARWPKICSNSS